MSEIRADRIYSEDGSTGPSFPKGIPSLVISGIVTATTFDGVATGLSGTPNVVLGIATVSAGSTSAPSITPTGDSNTGIFFPSADTIAFAEGGAEVARFDSSGRFGLGTNSPNAPLEVTSAAVNGAISDGIRIHMPGSFGAGASGNSLLFTALNASSAKVTYSSIAGLIETNTAGSHSGHMRFNTAVNGTNAERMRIDSAGRLLHGTTTNYITNERALFGTSFGPNSNSTAFADQITPLSVFGNFGGGSNSQQCSSALTVYGWASLATQPGAIMRGWWSGNGPSLGTPTLYFQIASNGNVTNTNNSYGSLSDVRYKQDIIDADSQWEDIKNIKIRKFRFINEVQKETEETPAPYLLGCIAQEVQEISPGLVELRGDDKDEDGNIIPEVLTLKYSVLYMKAIKALQEAQDRIETLEEENATLKDDFTALAARVAALEAN